MALVEDLPPAGRPLGIPLYVGSAFLAACALLVILVSTRWGPVLSDDSFGYVQAASDVLAGVPPRLDPRLGPLLQVSLAGLAILGADPISAARYLNAALFGLSVVLFGVAIYVATASPLFLGLGSVAFLLSAPFIRTYAEAISEPLYISVLILTAVALGLYGRRHVWYWFALAVVGTAACFASRYAGIAAVGAAVATLWFRKEPKLTRRLVEVGLVIVAAAASMGWYLALNVVHTGTATVHGPFRFDYIVRLPTRRDVYEILTWFMPGRLVRGFEYELALLIIVVILILAWLLHRSGIWRNTAAAALGTDSLAFRFFAWYLGFSMLTLFLSQGFVTIGDVFNQRLLLASYVAAVALAFISLGVAWAHVRGGMGIVGLALAIALVLLFASRAAMQVRTLYEEGAGFTSARWHVSETLAYLRLHPNVPLISTASKGVSYWIGRPVAEFGADPEGVPRRVCENGGWLVIIDSMPPEFYGVSTKQTVQPLHLVERFSEGSIYSCGP